MLKFSHLPLLSLFLLILLTTAMAAAGGHSRSRHIHPRPHHRNRNRNSTAAMTPAALPPQQQNSSSSASSASRQQQLNNIINALIGAGDFNNWANILSIAGPSYLPLSATFFIPADDSLVASPSENAFTDPLIFPYHIVPQRLTFAELLQFTTLSRLPTLLSSKSILVTNDSAANFTLDGSLLTHPDLFTSPAIVVHGISNLMDYSIYGDGALLHTNSRDHPSPAQQQQQQQQQQQVLTSDGRIRHSGERHSKEYIESWKFLIFWFGFLFY